MHVVASAFSDFAKQNAVHPVHYGTIQFPGAVKTEPVLVEVCDENILNLQKAAGVEERNGIVKALQSSGAQMKSNLARGFSQNFLEMRVM